MKKALALLAALTLIGAANTWAAATVALNNYDSDKAIFLADGTTKAPLAGTYVELWANGAAVTPTGGGATTFGLAEDGYFDNGYGIVAGLADSASTEFTLRAWRGGATYDAATDKAEVTWSQATGAWNPAAQPPTPPSGPALGVPSALSIVPVVPEPSTIALGILGGAALLFFRRK
jgi:hypothetical protein